MNKRTWPYGTRKTGKVVDMGVLKTAIVIIAGDDGEGYILTGVLPDVCFRGQQVTIEFTEGGPTGGYWKIVK
jgi:hypothetical protein